MGEGKSEEQIATLLTEWQLRQEEKRAKKLEKKEEKKASEPKWQAPVKDTVPKAKSEPKNSTIVKRDDPPLFTKEDFTNAILTVENEANTRDSAYWASVRPIPLTQTEIKDYSQKDSIQTIKESKAYKDSVDRERNKFKIANLAFNGYTHFNSYERKYINFPTLLEGLQYNAVEGLVINLPFAFQKRNETSFDYRIVPSFRYGFENKKFQAKIEGLKMLNLKQREMIQGGLGRYISQINDQNPQSYTNNSYFTILQGKNFAKLYQKSFAFFTYQRELINGVLLTAQTEYEDRTPLTNNATFNLRDRAFSPNAPNNSEIGNAVFPEHQAFMASARFRIRFNQKYIDRPDRKMVINSKFPDLYVYLKKAFPVIGSDVDYNLIKLGVSHKIMLGQFGTSDLNIWSGTFFGTKKLYFPDFQHFNGNRTYLTSQGVVNQFQVLDYYEYSTQDKFAELHYEHHFNEFIFNKIPLIKRLNLQAVASFNYLTTPALGQYMEFGAGIEHIFRFLRIDYFTGIRNGNHYRSGIRFGAGF